MKTFFRNIFMIAGLSGLVIISACKKQLDINNDPNNPPVENGTPPVVLPAAIMGTTAAVGGELAILGAIWGEYTSQAAASNQYKTIAAYQLNRNDFNYAYSQLFANGLKNFQFILDKSETTENWNFYLMAATMKAYTTQVLVDTWGSIPYFEALKGLGNLNPKFDDGYEIYVDLLKTLDTALSKSIDGSILTDLDKSSDLIFGGDMDKWIEFANTMELKLYLRMVNKKPAEAQAGIEKLFTNPDITFLTVDAGVSGFEDIASKSNPMYEQNIRQLNTANNIRASVTFTSYLMQKADPRIVYYFGSATPNAINQGDYTATDNTSLTAAILVQDPTDPVIFISAAESKFMQAEAAVRYPSITTGWDAKSLYDEGVLAAFAATGNDGSSFITGAYAFPAGSAATKIEAISTQKWIDCAYGVHFLEGFFEKNRTGFPKTSPVYSTDPAYEPGQFVISKNSVLSPGLLPQRLIYPNSEKQSNTNTPEEVPISTPVWWAL
jgi:hypothetical protein